MGCERITSADDNQPDYKKHVSRCLRPREEWIPIPVPSILSQATFARAQRKLKRNRELSSRNTKHSYLLTGLVFCGCNRRMYGDPCHGKPRYRCSDRQRRCPLPRKCFQGSVSSQTLDTAMWKTFLETLQHPDAILHRMHKMASERRDRKQALRKQIERLQPALKALNEREERFLEAYGAKVISLEQLKTKQQDIEIRRNQLLDESKQLQTMCDASPSRLQEGDIRAYLSQVQQRALHASFRLRRQLIRLFVDRIIIQGQSATVRAYLPTKVPRSPDGIIASTSGCSRGRYEEFPFEIEVALSRKSTVPQER